MAGKAAHLGGDVRLSDYLAMGLLAQLVPLSLIDEALSAHGRHGQRQRDLPAHAVAWYVVALSLYRGVNTEEVLRVVTEGMEFLGAPAVRREVGKSGISAARTRLGPEVMHYLAEQVLKPLARDGRQTPRAFYRDWRVVALDGSTMEVADEQVCREAFGVPGTQQGQTGYPQLRFVGLLEHGTHALFGVSLGGYKDSEMSLAHQTLRHLKPGMLCLADRGYAGFPMWQAARSTGDQLLWRVPRNRVLLELKRLADGSYLSRIKPSPVTLKTMPEPRDPTPIMVRVIDYELPGMPSAEPVYRLITTLLDPEHAPAEELAALYHARWSIETTFAEIKTTLKGSEVILRSKTPELVRQEFWGLLLAHHVTRKMMQEAALSVGSSADILSFKNSLNIVRRKLPASGAIPP